MYKQEYYIISSVQLKNKLYLRSNSFSSCIHSDIVEIPLQECLWNIWKFSEIIGLFI